MKKDKAMIQDLGRLKKNFPIAIILTLIAGVMVATQAVFVNLLILVLWVAFAKSIPKFSELFQFFLTLVSTWALVHFLTPFIYISFIFGVIAEAIIRQTSIHLGVIIGFVLIVLGTVIMVSLYSKDDLKFREKSWSPIPI